MAALITLVVGAGLGVLAFFISHYVEASSYPRARPLEEQGPIHVLDQIALTQASLISGCGEERLPRLHSGLTPDLLDYARLLKRQHPGWYLPDEVTPKDWRSAQIFARVVHTLVDFIGVEPERVRRGSRIDPDLLYS
jgi:hypothetical protein